MCYDVSFTVNIRVLKDYFPQLVYHSQLELDYKGQDAIQGVAIYPQYPVIYYPSAKQTDRDGHPHLRLMEWGVIRHTDKKEPSMLTRNKMLNIRSERIFGDTDSYWHVIRNRRCLMPVTGIFEHREIFGWKEKVPYWIRPADQPTFFLPALYSVAWIPDNNGVLQERWTFAILTRKANLVMSQIHNSRENPLRMNLFLPLDMAKEFLSPTLTTARYKDVLEYEIPSEALMYHPTDSIRSKLPRKDGKRKHEFKDWVGMPALGNNPLGLSFE